MVMEKLALAVASVASLMVIEPDAKVPATVGVPVKEMVLPDTVAVRPVGRPLWASTLYGETPPFTAIVPVNPARFTVHAVVLSEPAPSGGASGPPVTFRMRWFPKSE